MANLDTLSRALPILGPLIKRDGRRNLKPKEQLDKLASNLKKIQELLDADEGKPLTDSESKRRFELLQATFYEIEDVLDERNTTEQQQASNDAVSGGRRRHSLWEKLCHLLNSICSPKDRFAEVLFDLNEKADRVYGRAVSQTGYASASRKFERWRSSSFIIESEFPGREFDVESIKNIFIEDIPFRRVDNRFPFFVVALVGEAGIGKTALAQLVYNDPEMAFEFQKKVWIHVSESFDEVQMAKDILENLEGRARDVSGYEAVTQRIKRIIEDQKFLLVLDDIWVDHPFKWRTMKDYLSGGAPGSVILTTTRKERSANSIMGTQKTQIYRLQPLEEEACCSIVKREAFRGRSESHVRRYEAMAREIARKCSGSPLAAKVLGRLDVWEWERVLERDTWGENVGNDIFAHFLQGFSELEPAMKRCFSYFAVFPKNTTIDVERLIRIWMALGFLSSSTDDGLEQRGKSCIENLALHSLLQNIERDASGQITKCKIHDIVREFALYLSGNRCHMAEENKRGIFGVTQTTYHLFLEDEGGSQSQLPFSNSKLEKLRSFFCYRELEPSLLICLKSVRALTLTRKCIESIPEEIGNMLHIRFLCLISDGGDEKMSLPEAICNLYNLQTLCLEGTSFVGLPLGISKLMNLKYIYLDSDLDSEFVIPQRFERLANLRGLNIFCVRTGFNKLGLLKNLNQLQGKLHIRLEHVNAADVDEAEKAALIQKESLKSLVLQYMEEVELNVVEALRPHPTTQNLSFEGRGLPGWIPAVTSLRKLNLIVTGWPELCAPKLVNIGLLPYLEYITIRSSDMEILSRGFVGLTDEILTQQMDIVLFPELKELEFVGCPTWDGWEDIREEEVGFVRIMPKIIKVTIRTCHSLNLLPDNLLKAVASSLEHVVVEDCSPDLEQQSKNINRFLKDFST